MGKPCGAKTRRVKAGETELQYNKLTENPVDECGSAWTWWVCLKLYGADISKFGSAGSSEPNTLKMALVTF
jgi:hypothetical protein